MLSANDIKNEEVCEVNHCFFISTGVPLVFGVFIATFLCKGLLSCRRQRQ